MAAAELEAQAKPLPQFAAPPRRESRLTSQRLVAYYVGCRQEAGSPVWSPCAGKWVLLGEQVGPGGRSR